MEAQGPVASPTVADPIKPSALAPAAWRYSPRSAAPRRAITIKLFLAQSIAQISLAAGPCRQVGLFPETPYANREIYTAAVVTDVSVVVFWFLAWLLGLGYRRAVRLDCHSKTAACCQYRQSG